MASSASSDGLPVTESDLKAFWKAAGKQSNSYPRVNRKHNVNLVSMANVFIKIHLEVAGLSADEVASSWAKLQEKLGYNEKQMQEVHSVTADPKVGFAKFVEQCVDGTVLNRRAEPGKQGKKRKGESILNQPNAQSPPSIPKAAQGKRSKTMDRGGKGKQSADEDQGPAVPQKKLPHADIPSKSSHVQERVPDPGNQAPTDPPHSDHQGQLSPALARRGVPPAGCQQSTSHMTDKVPSPTTVERHRRTTAFQVSPSAKSPGLSSSPVASQLPRRSPRASLFTENQPVADGGRSTPLRATDGETLSPSGNLPKAAPSPRPHERWTSPRRVGRAAGTTPEGPPQSGRPPVPRPKKVAPLGRPCPSNTVPPCPAIVASAANKCTTCGFDIKRHRLRTQEQKMEKRVSAVKDTGSIVRRVKDDLKVLSEKGFQVSFVWFKEPEKDSKEEKKKKVNSNGTEAHFFGFGNVGQGWVQSEEIQKSYKRAAKAYLKAKRSRAHQAKDTQSKGQSRQTSQVAGRPDFEQSAAAAGNAYVLPQSIRAVVKSLQVSEEFSEIINAHLEKGEVNESSLKELVNDGDWLKGIFGEKVGPRALFKAGVKRMESVQARET